MISFTLILKYAGLIVTSFMALFSLFFEFTESKPGESKKTLTKPGKVAAGIIVISILLSFVGTIITERENEKEKTEQKEKDQKLISEIQNQSFIEREQASRHAKERFIENQALITEIKQSSETNEKANSKLLESYKKGLEISTIERDRLLNELNDSKTKIINLSTQLYSSTILKTLDVKWHFKDVPESISDVFELGYEMEMEFWENLDNMSDYSDGSISKALLVEYIFQPIIQSLATGDINTPIEDSQVVPEHLDDAEIMCGDKAFYLLFPLNSELNNAIVLGNEALPINYTDDEDDPAYLYPSERFPSGAVKYDYQAEASFEEGDLILEFDLQQSLFYNETNLKLPSIENFNIVIIDRNDCHEKAMKYMSPNSEYSTTGNWIVDENEDTNWSKTSILQLTVNGNDESKLTYIVNREGRYAHAPMNTDEEAPTAQFTFTIYSCKLKL